MAKIAFTQEVGRRVCEAMGLDPNKTIRIELSFAAGSVIIAEVTRYVTDDEIGPLVTLLHAVDWKQQSEVQP